MVEATIAVIDQESIMQFAFYAAATAPPRMPITRMALWVCRYIINGARSERDPDSISGAAYKASTFEIDFFHSLLDQFFFSRPR